MRRNLPIIGRRRLLQTAALGGAAVGVLAKINKDLQKVVAA